MINMTCSIHVHVSLHFETLLKRLLKICGRSTILKDKLGEVLVYIRYLHKDIKWEMLIKKYAGHTTREPIIYAQLSVQDQKQHYRKRFNSYEAENCNRNPEYAMVLFYKPRAYKIQIKSGFLVPSLMEIIVHFSNERILLRMCLRAA